MKVELEAPGLSVDSSHCLMLECTSSEGRAQSPWVYSGVLLGVSGGMCLKRLSLLRDVSSSVFGLSRDCLTDLLCAYEAFSDSDAILALCLSLV